MIPESRIQGCRRHRRGGSNRASQEQPALFWRSRRLIALEANTVPDQSGEYDSNERNKQGAGERTAERGDADGWQEEA